MKQDKQPKNQRGRARPPGAVRKTGIPAHGRRARRALSRTGSYFMPFS